MNGKTAKLLNRFTVVGKFRRRTLKRRWAALPARQRGRMRTRLLRQLPRLEAEQTKEASTGVFARLLAWVRGR